MRVQSGQFGKLIEHVVIGDAGGPFAKRLLDHIKVQGFPFQRVAEGPDGALLGTRHTGEWTDTVYLDGFSRNCYALRERKTSLAVPGSALVQRRATGDALNVLNTVLTWEQS